MLEPGITLMLSSSPNSFNIFSEAKYSSRAGTLTSVFVPILNGVGVGSEAGRGVSDPEEVLGGSLDGQICVRQE